MGKMKACASGTSRMVRPRAVCMKDCSFGRARNLVTGRCPKFSRKEKNATKMLQRAARGFIARRRARAMAAERASKRPRRSTRKK